MARIKHATLVANTVTTLQVTGYHSDIEVVNVDGVAAVYYRTDGVDPTIGGDDCEVLPAAIGGSTIPSDSSTVKLISAGTPKVSVKAIS